METKFKLGEHVLGTNEFICLEGTVEDIMKSNGSVLYKIKSHNDSNWFTEDEVIGLFIEACKYYTLKDMFLSDIVKFDKRIDRFADYNRIAVEGGKNNLIKVSMTYYGRGYVRIYKKEDVDYAFDNWHRTSKKISMWPSFRKQEN